MDEAEQALRSPDAEERVLAVRRLVRLDTERGWELVAGALADPAGPVAETAGLELGRARSELALGALLGRGGLGSKDEAVAARAAEALGRSPLALPPAPLLAALDRLADREEACALLLWALERVARENRWPEPEESFPRVARLVRGGAGTARVAARALACALALDRARGAELLRKARSSDAPGLRAAACTLSVEYLEPQAALELVTGLLDDRDWSVRSAALDALVALASPTAIELLIGRMTSDPRPRLRARVLDSLQRVSGLRHGPDPRPWQAWVAGLQGERPPPPAVRPADERSVALQRVAVFSDHLAFLIDFSGSMWMRRDGGPSRKELVDVRFAELLERLDSRTRFLLIPYTQVPHPWQEELAAATPANVARAARFFEECQERGAGDFWEAALFALGDPEIDTLVVLTDGVPTGGAYNRMELLTRLFAERSLARPVTVDALLIGASHAALASWGELCAATGGRCIPVELSGD